MRPQGMSTGQAVTFGRHRFDPRTGQLWHGRQEVKLTPRAAAVLAALVERAGQPVTRDELFASVWGDTVVSDAALTACVRELREALADDPSRPRFIETRHRRGYRFVARLAPPPTESGPASRSAVVSRPGALVVGRDRELNELRLCLARIRAAERQIVFVTGEAGIGKTTIVEAFLAEAAERHDLRVAHGRCVEHYGAGEAFLPLMEALTRACREPDGRRLVRVLRHHAPSWLVQMPSVITAAELRSLLRQASGVTKERMLRELADAVEVMTRDTSLALWLEDLHWSDVSTLDWLAYVARRPGPARLLVVASYRSGQVTDREHPLEAVKAELEVQGRCREITPSLLDEPAIGEYLARRFPSAAPLGELARTIRSRTGGNPLFVVNVSDELVRNSELVERSGQWEVAGRPGLLAITIPDDVRRMIDLQFDRLTTVERRVVESASAVGAQFSAAAAAAGADMAVGEVESCCAALARRESFLFPRGAEDWPDGTLAGRYGFRHALYRESVYERVPPGRRVELHRRIGERLEAALGPRAGEMATELAMHFDQGRDFGRAIRYLHSAGAIAMQRGAAREAVTHLTRALDLLRAQPDTSERAEQEIALQIALGSPLMAIKGRGAPEVEQAYLRAQDLCEQAGDAPPLFPALWGLFLFRRSRGEIDAAADLGQRLLTLAQVTNDPGLLVEAHHAVWATRFAQGDLLAARDHAATGVALYEVDRDASLAATYGNHDPGVCGLGHSAWALELLGESAGALGQAQAAIALARTLGHRFSEAHALLYAARVHQLRGDWQTTRAYADTAAALATEGEFVQLLAWADVTRGWARVEGTEVGTGLEMLHRGIAAIRTLGSKDFLTYFLSLLADSLSKAGQRARALDAVTEALAVVDGSGERFYAPELHRLHGELLRGTGRNPVEASACFARARHLAQGQGALTLERRALASLQT